MVVTMMKLADGRPGVVNRVITNAIVMHVLELVIT